MTAQAHEKLILDGNETSMAFCPPIPIRDSRIIIINESDIQGRDIIFSTACWRRYIGT